MRHVSTFLASMALAAPSVAAAANSGLFAPYEVHTPPGMLNVGAFEMAAGDLNGDGRTDVALYATDSFDARFLYVYFQQAAGTLAGPVKMPFTDDGVGVTDIAIGDVDDDGFADVVVVRWGGQRLGFDLFRGTPTGLASAEFHAVSGPLWLVTIVDLDGDGHKEIVATTPSGFDGGVHVIRWDPAGFFNIQLVIRLEQFSGVAAQAVGDATGDGRADIVLMRPNGGGLDGTPNVLVYPQLADGRFDAAQTYISVLDAGKDSSQRGRATQMALADVTGDGRLDLVLGHEMWEGFNVGVLAQNAAGRFDPPAFSPALGIDPIYVDAGDVNGDGRADVVINDTTDGTMGVFLQSPAGGLGGVEDYATPDKSNGHVRHGVAFGDVTGDGRSDVMLLDVNRGLVVFPRAGAVMGADVAASVLPDRAEAQVGERIQFKLQLRNLGPASASGVAVAVSFPTSTLPSDVPAGCTAARGTLTCSPVPLAAGAIRALTFSLRSATFGALVVTARVTTVTLDPNLTNNTASAQVKIKSRDRHPPGPGCSVRQD